MKRFLEIAFVYMHRNIYYRYHTPTKIKRRKCCWFLSCMWGYSSWD